MNFGRWIVTALLALGAVVSACHADAQADPDIRIRSRAAGERALGDSVSFNSTWDASSGLLPDQACPAWTRAVTDSAPALTNGTLRINTTACPQNVSYSQRDTMLAMPDTVVVEVRLRFASGTECIGPCGHDRQAASVAITTSGSTGLLFFVGNNEIFLTNGECSGITSLAVPTTDVAHNYRIIVSNGATVRVYRDGVLALSGHTYSSVSDNGSVPRIYWGEGSSLAYGAVFWEYVKHNAHKSGCTAAGVGGDGGGRFAGNALELHTSPNPFRSSIRLEWTLPQRSHVRVGICDVMGRQVRHLVDGEFASGRQTADWDGLDATGASAPAGAYLCRVETNAATASIWAMRTR